MTQTTIKNLVHCTSIGVHTGRNINMSIKPAPANTGIVFVRSDIKDVNNVISSNYKNVTDTILATTISNQAGVSVSTIEHILAAFWGCKIDNAIVELDGPEVPIMDGSSKVFVYMLEFAGITKFVAPRKSIKIKKEIFFEDNGSYCNISPADNFSINVGIDFTNQIIGKQEYSFFSTQDFKEDISCARTFGFLKDVQYLQTIGKAKGASLDNAIAIEDSAILNHDGLRYKNEFVRHKILDSIGDLNTASAPIIGEFNSYKPGHQFNNLLLRKILEDQNNWEYA